MTTLSAPFELDREGAAVVAHGLLSSLAVLSGSIQALIAFGDRLDAAELEEAHRAFAGQGYVVHGGLETILSHSSLEFAEAATMVVLAARALRQVSEVDAPQVLEGLLRSVSVLRTGLLAATRGLPPDVREFLDERAIQVVS